jgi:hypothetical protein
MTARGCVILSLAMAVLSKPLLLLRMTARGCVILSSAKDLYNYQNRRFTRSVTYRGKWAAEAMF